MKTPSMTTLPVFDIHLASVLRTKKLAEVPDLTDVKRLRSAWSCARQPIPSTLLKLEHRNLILN